MPAFCTHYIFLDEMTEYLEENSNFRFYKEAAQIGTQGPDIFFFSGVIPFLMPGHMQFKTGSALHRAKPSEIFEAFAEYCKFSPNTDIAKSYIYGFILHYALDRNCHPYVYSLQNRILQKNRHIHRSSAHNRIETAMDTYLLSKRKNIADTRDFDSAKTLEAGQEVIDEIAHLLSFVTSEVTAHCPSKHDIKRAVSDTILMQKILRDKHRITELLCRAAEMITGPFCGYYKFSSMIRPKDLEKAKKYANIENAKWTSPYSGEESTLSFEDLFLHSKEDAMRLINGFEMLCRGCSDGYKVTNNLSFLTGTEIRQ